MTLKNPRKKEWHFENFFFWGGGIHKKIHVYILRCRKHMSNPNFSQQLLWDTNQQQATLWMNSDKVLFSPPSSVLSLPGTLIGSMQSNVTNWMILCPELEAADPRGRECSAQSSSNIKKDTTPVDPYKTSTRKLFKAPSSRGRAQTDSKVKK